MKVVHCKKDKYTVYIGRPSIFGNPFVIGKDGTREEVIMQYMIWVQTQPQVMDAIRELAADAVLGCWCKPEVCHGDVIVEIYNVHHKLKPHWISPEELADCKASLPRVSREDVEAIFGKELLEQYGYKE